MEIVVNGETLEVRDGIDVASLIEKLGIKDRVMGVAINSKIVKKEEWDSKIVQQNDKVEFLSFVGGG